tara:strand:- start:6640 stop:6864 length:225 start_codon:yes stop_codon:yes gene_type:complete
MMYLKVEESTDLVRDSETNAILNVNQTALQAYKSRKGQFKKIDNMEEKIEHLDNRLLNIENLLLSLKSKLDNQN